MLRLDQTLLEEMAWFDVVIVGAGAAGMYAALNLRSDLSVLLLSKEELSDCNSRLAQGGIAMTLDGEYDSHVEDTLKAGSFYNDQAVVEKMIQMSPVVIKDLLDYRTAFDRQEDGSLALTAEGGHTKRRILHCRDFTGAGLMDALTEELLKRTNIRVKTQAMAIDLLLDTQGAVAGLIYEQEGLNAVRTSSLIIATGGIGGLFEATTNKTLLTGDGILMAQRAGAALKDLEFIQYHPTAMQLRNGGTFLISEAVRGEGGILVNELGERFMVGKHPMAELAPRDVVSKAINEALIEGHQIFVDVRHFEKGAFKNRFPSITEACLENGIDPETMPIPIEPVEHYYMGGIQTDASGRTMVSGLYASGEAACSGFHGANRLASNSLLECLAMSKLVAGEINETYSKPLSLADVVLPAGLTSVETTGDTLCLDELKSLRAIFKAQFSKVFTIVKQKQRMSKAVADFEAQRVELLAKLPEPKASRLYAELLNGLSLGILIGEATQKREKSLGGFLLEEDSNVQ